MEKPQNAVNHANKCLSCSKKLSRRYTTPEKIEHIRDGEDRYIRTKIVKEEPVFVGFGAYADGFFCSKTCGWKWAVAYLNRNGMVR